MEPSLSKLLRSIAFPLLVVVILLALVQGLYKSPADNSMTFPAFQKLVEQKKIEAVVVKTRDLVVEGKVTGTGERFQIGFTDRFDMIQFLSTNGIDFRTDVQKQSVWLSLLSTFLPIILMVVFFLFIMNQMQGGGSKVMSFGKSRAKRMSIDAPKITFKDVAGVDEAVEELQEIKEFLENPKRFQALGARIPKGVLLFGPPGTGKTLHLRFRLRRDVRGGRRQPGARSVRSGQAEPAVHHLHG
jgi:cell division protease FtsH